MNNFISSIYHGITDLLVPSILIYQGNKSIIQWADSSSKYYRNIYDHVPLKSRYEKHAATIYICVSNFTFHFVFWLKSLFYSRAKIISTFKNGRHRVQMLEVEYVFNNKRYKALFPYDPNRQSNFLKCEADGEDFSEEMEKMLGPDETMHRQKVTPEMIGKQSVEVVYSDFLAVENNFQSQKKFGRNDVISIS